eukprot:CAMPEP_0178943234 /NCGR_PEP_ID=MMETSP0789-20121207/2468_1 /TAXON_ID=3005 /ORGANISM="Rhizosolenia setigera, Strain CCMP 1694" /LENGTH=405 /DNA_ID=CAMNT_0020622795 /DNA_START=89 /DNA_END=1303 /DNA_ORIENTATION=+
MFNRRHNKSDNKQHYDGSFERSVYPFDKTKKIVVSLQIGKIVRDNFATVFVVISIFFIIYSYIDTQGIENKDLRRSSFDPLIEKSENYSKKCRCVDCKEDNVCGGLWRGNKYVMKNIDYNDRQSLHSKAIHLVVSHCKSDLSWISDFTKGYEVSSIHVISKCGFPVTGAPDKTTIEVLSNVGRCDHTYAYYLSTVLDQKLSQESQDIADENTVVFFLKDDISEENKHQLGEQVSFEDMLNTASSQNGFSCRVNGLFTWRLPKKSIHFSSYHLTELLSLWRMEEYKRNEKGYKSDEVEFRSEYLNLGEWYDSITSEPMPEVALVCYGGAFAASVSNIRKHDAETWKRLEKSLSRGNSIEEGHYAERSWALLLSDPLEPFMSDALLDYSDTINNLHGALVLVEWDSW